MSIWNEGDPLDIFFWMFYMVLSRQEFQQWMLLGFFPISGEHEELEECHYASEKCYYASEKCHHASEKCHYVTTYSATTYSGIK